MSVCTLFTAKMDSTRTDQLTVEIVNNLRAALDAQTLTNEKMRTSWEEIANRAHELSIKNMELTRELEDTRRQLRRAKRKLSKMQDVLLEEEFHEKEYYGSNRILFGESPKRTTY